MSSWFDRFTFRPGFSRPWWQLTWPRGGNTMISIHNGVGYVLEASGKSRPATHREYVAEIERLRGTTQQRCTAFNEQYGLTCKREQGHEQSHQADVNQSLVVNW